MDSESNNLMIEVANREPDSYAFGALGGSDGVYVAYDTADSTLLYLAIVDTQTAPTINEFTFYTENVVSATLTIYDEKNFVKQTVSFGILF